MPGKEWILKDPITINSRIRHEMNYGFKKGTL